MPFIKSTRKRRGKPWVAVEQATAPPMQWYPPQPAPQPAAKPQRPRVELAPGETLTRDEYRQKDAGDLKPGLFWSAVLGVGTSIPVGLLASLGQPASDAIRWGASVGGSVFLVSFLAATFKVVWSEGSSIKIVAEKITRHDLDGDGRIGQEPTINWNTTLQQDQTSHLARARMPASQVKNWRAFCYAYTGGKCAFSSRAAKSFHVEDVYASVLQDWTSQDNQLSLIEPSSIGPRLTPEPTTQGKAMIAIYGNTPLQDLGTMLQRYTGADRQQAGREG